jgi:hypothetical protein
VTRRKKTLAEMARDTAARAVAAMGFMLGDYRAIFLRGYFHGYLAGRRAERRAAKKRVPETDFGKPEKRRDG